MESRLIKGNIILPLTLTLLVVGLLLFEVAPALQDQGTPSGEAMRVSRAAQNLQVEPRVTGESSGRASGSVTIENARRPGNLRMQEQDPYKISTSGAVISESGTYYLDEDLQKARSDENVITITASDVVLDCQGNTISGLGNGIGVRVEAATRLNRVIIQNCNFQSLASAVWAVNTRELTLDHLLAPSLTRPIYIERAQYLTMVDNLVEGNGGVEVWDSQYLTFTRNSFSGAQFSAGLDIDDTRSASWIELTDNEICDNGDYDLHCGSGHTWRGSGNTISNTYACGSNWDTQLLDTLNSC